MNVPAVAQRTFEENRNRPEMIALVNLTLEGLKKLNSPEDRAKLLHTMINNLNVDVFSHPIVKQFSPCGKGCSSCCYTQVSVTEDEAIVLAKHIQDGLVIDQELLKIQQSAQNDSDEFFKLPFQSRKCIFLDDQGACRVYEDRPSVCRTNAVLGSAEQCDTSVEIKPQRLIKTPQSDMVIYAQFLFSQKNGALPNMIADIILDKDS